MKQLRALKKVNDMPMTHQTYKDYRDWVLSESKNSDDQGWQTRLQPTGASLKHNTH